MITPIIAGSMVGGMSHFPGGIQRAVPETSSVTQVRFCGRQYVFTVKS
jgi:hypothetical protein